MKREFIGIMGKLIVELEETEAAAVVRVEGEADIYTSAELEKILEAYFARGQRNILLDAERLTYLDSSTLAVLLKVQKKLKAAGGNLKLLRLGSEPLKVFRAAGLLELFDTFEERNQALDSFR